jgi:hypothetical protein
MMDNTSFEVNLNGVCNPASGAQIASWSCTSADTPLRSCLHRFRRWLVAAVGGAALVSTSACIHLERFSSQATEFNIQVADAQNKTMLLNIVRAANRFPMHFTELSTLSGTGTRTEGGTVTAPVGILHGGMGTGSVAPTFSVTETPTFNVAVLETQEFYRGMLHPLTPDQIANYVDEGLPIDLVFKLAFGEILYQESPTAEPKKLENNFHPIDYLGKRGICPEEMTAEPKDGKSRFSEYSCFNVILRALIDRHLTTEMVKTVDTVGPLMAHGPFGDLRWLSGLDPKTFTIKSVDLDACTEKPDQTPADICPEGLKGLPQDQQDTLKKGQLLYRVQTESPDYRFCFNEPYIPFVSGSEQPSEQQKAKDLGTRIGSAHIPADLICHNRLPKRYKDPNEPKDPKEMKARPRSGAIFALGLTNSPKDKDAFALRVEPRSTEGVLYYLGEITRCETGLDHLSVCSIPHVYVPYRNTPTDGDVLFSISKGNATSPSRDEWDGGHIAVNWGGQRYEVEIDPEAKNRSGQVLRVMTQLLALNRSAKDFPTPSIVPIISH